MSTPLEAELSEPVASLEHPGDTLVDWARSIGTELQRALTAALRAMPEMPSRPNQLVKAFGVNRDTAGRVLSMVTATDPLEVLFVAPGPGPLRRVIRAASDHGVPDALLEAARMAVVSFDRLIESSTGTRSGLDTIIGSCLPSVGERLDLSARYSIFRGHVQLHGLLAESWIQSVLIHPSDLDESRHDVVFVHGLIGLQRFRPGASVHTSTRKLERPGEDASPGSKAEVPAFDLEQFCANPPAIAEQHRVGRVMRTAFTPPGIGPRAKCDALSVEIYRCGFGRFARPGPDARKAVAAMTETPSAALLSDVYFHDDAFERAQPELLVYNMGAEGQAQIHDPERDSDLVRCADHVQSLGRTPSGRTSADFDGYSDLLDHVCDRLGWDASAFRGFRSRIQYPVLGWQYTLAFETSPAHERGAPAP